MCLTNVTWMELSALLMVLAGPNVNQQRLSVCAVFLCNFRGRQQHQLGPGPDRADWPLCYFLCATDPQAATTQVQV